MMKSKFILLFIIIILMLIGCNKNRIECKEDRETLSDGLIEEEIVNIQRSGIEKQTRSIDTDKYNISDENLKKSIQECVQLKEGTEIDFVEWVDEEEKCMRVSIRYVQQPENLWYNHVEDYFFFVKEDETEILYVDYSNDGKFIREVWENPDFSAHFEDVNFDGQADLIISLGVNGVAYGEQYCAYLYTEEGYEYCPSFEYFCRYSVDYQNKQIVSTIYENTADGRVEVISYYIFRDNVFQKLEKEGISQEQADEGNSSVKSETIQIFLNGNGEATLSEKFVSICSEIELDYIYEGTIGDIVEGYYEDFAKYLNNQQLSDLKVSAKDFEFANGGKFTYVLIDGELNQSNDLFLILKESDNQIKICFEGQNSEHTEFYLRDCGRIDELANSYDKHYANYYYIDKTGNVFELFEWSEYVLELSNDEKQFLGVENIDNFDEVYIEEYIINDNEYYTIGFGNAINEANQDKILEYLIEGNFVENKKYLAEDEIRKKIYEMIYGLEIDLNVIADLFE